MTTATLRMGNWRALAGLGLGTPLLVLTLLGMMLIPLPPLLLDLLFTFNIALSLVVLLVAVYALRPLDFAVFPTLLLVATLLRLALNVASTRLVLLHGHTGPGAAGHVIEAFGAFVIGGNYAVGLIVFIILMIINFAVVTKGAGRVAEGVAELFGLRELYVVLWGWLRIPVALALIGAALSIVYRHVPSERQSFGSVVPGAVLAVVAWAVTSVAFSFYLANFADYGVTYGGLGAAVGLLLYFYLSASIVLLGAEINAAIQDPATDEAPRTTGTTGPSAGP